MKIKFIFSISLVFVFPIALNSFAKKNYLNISRKTLNGTYISTKESNSFTKVNKNQYFMGYNGFKIKKG